MKTALTYFFFFVAFLIGVAVGTYNTNIQVEKTLAKEEPKTIALSMQDAVIKKVQNDDFWADTPVSGNTITEKPPEITPKPTLNNNIVVVSAIEEKISPDAKLIIKKYFERCGHSTITITDMRNDLINLTQKELEQKFEGWEVEKFNHDEVILSRTINANCEDHFVIQEEDGVVTVYNEVTDSIKNVVKTINVDLFLLDEKTRQELAEGINVYGKEELESILESFACEGEI